MRYKAEKGERRRQRAKGKGEERKTRAKAKAQSQNPKAKSPKPKAKRRKKIVLHGKPPMGWELSGGEFLSFKVKKSPETLL
jgi:hypothetical protein